VRFIDQSGHNPILVLVGLGVAWDIAVAAVIAIGFYVIFSCLATSFCRNSIINLIQAGISSVDTFINALRDTIRDQK